MQTPERFGRAVNGLVQSYLNDTLVAMDCEACAVGSIVAAGYGKRLRRNGRGVVCEDGIDTSAWHLLVWDWVSGSVEEVVAAQENIDVTGYSVGELAKIESAFMTTQSEARCSGKPDPNYEGLLAVFNVLCEIEGIEDSAPYVALLAKDTCPV